MQSKFRIFNQAHIAHPAMIYLQEASGTLDKKTILSPFACIKNLAVESYHEVVVRHDLSMIIQDENGNLTKPVLIESGRSYRVKRNKGQWECQRSVKIGSNTFEILNVSKIGAPDILFMRGDYVVGRRHALIPGDVTSGRLHHTFHIRYFSCEPNMERMESYMSDEYSCRIPYLHLHEADLIMTGGGYGSTALPCTFHLENIKPWKS